MCDTASNSTPDHEQDHAAPAQPVRRRSIIGAALAGAGVAAVGAVGGAGSAQAAPRYDVGTPRRPLLPVQSDQPQGPVVTQLGTAGGPQAEYVRTGTSTALTVEGHNYVVDCGRASVTQYLNAGLQFGKLKGLFITHLHADHLADYYNYFLLESGQPNAEGDMLPHRYNRGLPLPVFGPGSAGGLPPKPAPTRDQPNIPTIPPTDPDPGIQTLTDKMTEAFSYSYNVFLRGDGYHPITEFTSDIHEIAIPASANASYTNTAPSMHPFQIHEDERVKVTAILVPHGEVFPCFAYRFELADGRSVVFSGDTSKSDNVVELAGGADILVHCAMQWDVIAATNALKGKTVENTPELKHLHDSLATTYEAGQVARAAEVKQLVLTHLIPSNPKDVADAVWKITAAAGFRSGNVHVGNDLDRIVLPARRR